MSSNILSSKIFFLIIFILVSITKFYKLKDFRIFTINNKSKKKKMFAEYNFFPKKFYVGPTLLWEAVLIIKTINNNIK